MKEPQPEEHASFKLYAVNRLVLDLDAFHILTADIQDTVYIRFKEAMQHSNGKRSLLRLHPAVRAALISASPYPVEQEWTISTPSGSWL